MNAAPSLLALFAGLLLQDLAFGCEEDSGAAKSDLFLARVGEPTTVRLTTGADAANLQPARLAALPLILPALSPAYRRPRLAPHFGCTLRRTAPHHEPARA